LSNNDSENEYVDADGDNSTEQSFLNSSFPLPMSPPPTPTTIVEMEATTSYINQ
jgi:hypothetical protein